LIGGNIMDNTNKQDMSKTCGFKDAEIQNNIIRLKEERKEYIKQLEYALRYFDNEKTYDNNVAYSIAVRLIKNELDKERNIK
jgi:hypothetical protein